MNTPLTDEVEWETDQGTMVVCSDKARELERQLFQARRELAEAKVKAFEDGKAAQAILELRARDKFIAELKKEIKDDRTQLRTQLEEAKSGSYQIAHKSLLAQLSDVKESLEAAKEKYTAEERQRWQNVSADFHRALKARSELLNQLEAANRDAAAMRDALEAARSLVIRHHETGFVCENNMFCPVCSPNGSDAPFDEAFAALSSPAGKDYVRRDEAFKEIDQLLADGDRLEIWIEDGGVILSKNGVQITEPHESIESALAAATKQG